VKIEWTYLGKRYKPNYPAIIIIGGGLALVEILQYFGIV
jgi:hypothetical protein